MGLIIDQAVTDTVFNVISTRQFGNGVRGQIDVGGWVSIVASNGEEMLMERVGELELVDAKYRVLSGAGKQAKIYDEAPKSIDDIKDMKEVDILKAKEVNLSNLVVLEAEDRSVQIFAQLNGES